MDKARTLPRIIGLMGILFAIECFIGRINGSSKSFSVCDAVVNRKLYIHDKGIVNKNVGLMVLKDGSAFKAKIVHSGNTIEIRDMSRKMDGSSCIYSKGKIFFKYYLLSGGLVKVIDEFSDGYIERAEYGELLSGEVGDLQLFPETN